MEPERWQRIERLFHAALQLDTSQRHIFLHETCDEDEDLRREVEVLLSRQSQAESFMEAPALDVAAKALAQDRVQLKRGAVEGDLHLARETISHSPEFLGDPTIAEEIGERSSDRADVWIGRRIGPYKIVKEIGVGGMGEVYRAVRADDQYRKEVAIKVMRTGQDSNFVTSRFKNERQILASLDHPNIARLHDGGTDEEGVPYFVMELIEGQPIDKYCDYRHMSTTERLKLFSQVCSAVQYAHQRLIIHRDIKPSNILITGEGVPKLLDFGIAKILDVETATDRPEPTLTVLRAFTPAYASPEQIKGEPITTASDVYSLGVVLYELLTGHHPYSMTSHPPAKIIQAVCETEPERPSNVVTRTVIAEGGSKESAITPEKVGAVRDGSPEKLRKRLRGDLDNIALTALRKEPQRRYVSVEQFNEDIRRHLGGLPVIAHTDSLSYRAGKFVRRNKVGVSAATLVVLSLAAGMIATLHEVRIAQRRLNDVRSLANSLIFDVHDSVRDLPGSTPARKLIVQKGLLYLDSLAQESGGHPALQRELAAAYERIGEVQGDPFSPNLGDFDGALKSYQKSLAIRRVLLASNSRSLEDQIGSAEVSRLTGNVLVANGQTAAALENDRRAVQMLELALPAHAKHIQLMRELEQAYGAEADVLASRFTVSNLGDVSTALSLRGKQLQLAEQLSSYDPRNPDSRRKLAQALGLMGDQLFLAGQRREASQYYDRAKRMFEDLAVESPSAKALIDLHDSFYRLISAEHLDGKVEQAIASARRALEIAKKLSLADPENTQAGLLLAADYAILADAISSSSHRGEARSAIAKAIKIDMELVNRNPKNTEFQKMQGYRFKNAGNVFYRSADYSRALQYYSEAQATLSRIQEEDPANMGVRLSVSEVCNDIGAVLKQLGHYKRASKMYHQALDLVLTEVSTSHPNQDALYAAANSYTGLGDIETLGAANARRDRPEQIEQWRDARSFYLRSLKLWSQVPEPGAFSPNGSDCISPSVVAHRLARCNEALRQLKSDSPRPAQ